jgi:hypothetical protein
MGDMAMARCGLDVCAIWKYITVNVDLHGLPQASGLITARKGKTLAMGDGFFGEVTRL